MDNEIQILGGGGGSTIQGGGGGGGGGGGDTARPHVTDPAREKALDLANSLYGTSKPDMVVPAADLFPFIAACMALLLPQMLPEVEMEIETADGLSVKGKLKSFVTRSHNAPLNAPSTATPKSGISDVYKRWFTRFSSIFTTGVIGVGVFGDAGAQVHRLALLRLQLQAIVQYKTDRICQQS